MPGAVVGLVAAPLVGLLGEGAAIAVSSFVLRTGASLAASAALSAMSRKKTPAQERQAQVSKLAIGEVARAAIFGIAATGGSLVDIFNWGGKYGTDNVTFCVALADHACDGMQGYLVGDEYYPWTGDGPQAAFNGKLILEFRNARADGWAPPAVAVEHGGWTATDRGCGVTHMWVTWISDEKVWPQGLPQFRWEVRGYHPEDPRRGDHNPENPETWTFSRNPILERNAWARGIYATGRHGQPEHLLIGRGLSAEEAPPERIIAAANLCDEDIDGLSRYYADGVIPADMDFVEVEELFATAVAGTLVQREGGLEIEPGQAKAVVVTITDDDLVAGEPIEFSEFRPDGDGGRVNSVIPRYVSVRHGYRDHSGPIRRDQADIIADGGPRELTLSMPLVTGEAVADRNAEIARRMARFEGRGGITLPPEYQRLEEGDWVAWTSALKFNGATRRFRIEAFALNAARRNRLSLREIGASAFGEAEPIADPVPAPPPPPVIDALELPGASVQAITLAGDTSVIPAVRATWDTPVDAAVRAIRLEVRTAGDTDASPTRFEDVGAGVGIGTNGVAADQVLQARLVPVGDPSRPVVPSVWFTITTGQLVAGDVAPTAPIAREVHAQAMSGLRQAIENAQALQEEEGRRSLEVADVLDRLDLGFLLDPVARSAIIRSETIADGVGPSGLPETLVQMSTRLVAADAANTAAVANALLTAKAYADTVSASAVIGLATVVQLNASIAASAFNIRSDVTAEIASAVSNLISAAQLASSLSTARGQWEAYATAAAAGAVIGLDTIAAREAALAVARGQWESYASAAAASAVIGLDTVAAREAAIAAAGLTLRAYADAAVTTGTANLATQSALNGVSASAALALSTAITADGLAKSIIGLMQNVDGKISGIYSVNDGLTSAVDILADIFRVSPGSGGGILVDGPNKLFKIYDADSKTVLKAGGSIRFWSGPSSVPDGSETEDNGVLALGPGITSGGRFNGRVLTAPFLESASGLVTLGSSWTTVLEAGVVLAAGGAVQINLFDLEMSGDATADGEGYRNYEIEWRLVSVNPSHGDAEVIFAGEFAQTLNPGQPVTFVASRYLAFDFHTVAKGGSRLLLFQMQRKAGSATTLASVRNLVLRGWTLAGG